jgi:hypothetical protein
MTTYLKTAHADNYSKITAPAKKLPSFGIGRLLFAVILAVILFLLGQSMCVITSIKASGSAGTFLPDNDNSASMRGPLMAQNDPP